MASHGRPYVLVGFSVEIDRRPMTFIEPLPSANVCTACGVVPSVIACLPCGHFYCKSCCHHCGRSGGWLTCPLDMNTCPEDKVTWIELPAKTIMSRQVLCWNKCSGCDVITVVADITKHFQQDCQHHMACCPLCGSNITASNACAHLESHWCNLTASSTSSIEPREAVNQEDPATRQSGCDMQAANPISDAFSVPAPSISSEVNEVTHGLTILSAIGANCETAEERKSSVKLLLQEAVDNITTEIIEQSSQLNEVVHNIIANQQTFHNSVLERDRELMVVAQNASKTTEHQNEQQIQLTAFREAAHGWHRDVQGRLDRLSTANSSQSERFGAILRSFHDINEALRGTLGELFKKHNDSLEQKSFEASWEKINLTADARKLLASISSAIPMATTHKWTLEVSDLMKRACNMEEVDVVEQMYLRGYCLSGHVRFFILWKRMTVSLYVTKNEGRIDKYLRLPSTLNFSFCILHPDGRVGVQWSVKLHHPLLHTRGPRGPEITTADLGDLLRDRRMHISLTAEPGDSARP